MIRKLLISQKQKICLSKTFTERYVKKQGSPETPFKKSEGARDHLLETLKDTLHITP
jgi:hypothetical protein